MPDKIIAYRSKTEMYQDEFLNDMLFPWLYEHWYVIPIAVAAIWIWAKVADRRNRR
jgi:hypothetical protein